MKSTRMDRRTFGKLAGGAGLTAVITGPSLAQTGAQHMVAVELRQIPKTLRLVAARNLPEDGMRRTVGTERCPSDVTTGIHSVGFAGPPGKYPRENGQSPPSARRHGHTFRGGWGRAPADDTSAVADRRRGSGRPANREAETRA